MIDSAAEALARRILVAFPPSTARTRADVKRVPVPVGRLLNAELDARADRFASLPETEWIDPDGEGLSAARTSWREAVRTAARFPADVWEEAVAHAARLAVSHLVRPAETAAADAFADADGLAELPVGAALARVRIFGAYGYLPEIAARYAERKGVQAIDRPGLERLLRRIDRRMVEDFGPDEWTVLAGPLYELVAGPGGTVGVGLLRALFEAKGRHEIARTMVSDAYTREALHTHLLAVMPRPTTASAAEPGQEPAETAAPPAPETPAPDDFVPELPHAPELEQLALPGSPGEPGAPDESDASLLGAPAALESDAPALGPPTEEHASASEPDEDSASAPDENSVLAPQHSGAPTAEEVGAPALDDADASAVAADPPEGPEAVAPPAQSGTPTPASGPQPPHALAAETPAAPPSLAVPPELGAPLPAPDDADPPEPLWKRMLQRADAGPAERPLAVTPDPDATDALGVADPAQGAPAPEDAVDAAPEADDAREPLWRRFATPDAGAAPEPDDEDGWAVAPTLAASPAVALDAPLPPPRTLADRFAAPDALPPASAPAPASLEAVELAVLGPGPDDRRAWFVNTLFSASADDYQATLRALAEVPTWTAATQIIASEVFRKHRVNIYSEAALAFTDAVETQIDARAGGAP